MFDPSVGRWFQGDPEGLETGDENTFRYVRNNPTNKIDPSGFQEARLGIELIDRGKAPPPTSPTEPEKDRLTSQDELEKTLNDGRLGYFFEFNFVVANKYRSDKRYGLQAVRSYLIVVGPDANGKLTLTRPSTAQKDDGYWNYKIDQTSVTMATLADPKKLNVPTKFPDQRAVDYIGGTTGGFVVSPTPEKQIPAVFAVQIVEAVAGLSKINYAPEKMGGKVRSNSLATKAEYEKLLGDIDVQRTDTTTYYVFYNPNNGKDPCNPVTEKTILDLLKDDTQAQQQLQRALKAVKKSLKDPAFEAFSFPESNMPVLIGHPPKK